MSGAETTLHSVSLVRIDDLWGPGEHGYEVRETRNGETTRSDVFTEEEGARRYAALKARAGLHPESWDPRRLRGY